MTVQMVRVRIMRMPVPNPRMAVNVGVRFGRRIARRMLVPVVFVVHVLMLVDRRFVFVLVLMPFG